VCIPFIFLLIDTFSNVNKLYGFYCLQDATDGHGADVIVEMLANASLTKDLQLVALKGRIGVCLTCSII